MNSTTQPTSESLLEENKALVRRVLSAYGAPDAERTLDECTAPSYIHHFTGGPRDANIDEYKQQMAPFSGAFPDGHLEIDALLAEGDLVSARMTFSGTHQGNDLGVPATGRHISVPIFTISRVAGGLVQETWQLTDNLGLRQQLGILPTRSGG